VMEQIPSVVTMVRGCAYLHWDTLTQWSLPSGNVKVCQGNLEQVMPMQQPIIEIGLQCSSKAV
jgi:hypothetical protein